MITAYDKYAQDVGVVPRGEKFDQTAKNNFPPVTPSNILSTDLAKMFVPGYPLNQSTPAVATIN